MMRLMEKFKLHKFQHHFDKLITNILTKPENCVHEQMSWNN